MRININAHVRAKLTTLGAAAYNSHYQKRGIPTRFWQVMKEGDTVELPLWDAMHIFGPHLFMGSPVVPFQDNSIEFVMGVEQAGWLVTPPDRPTWWEPRNDAQFSPGQPHKIEPVFRLKEL